MKKTKIIDPKRDIINTLNYKKIFNQPLTYYQLLYFSHYKFVNNSEFDNYLSELVQRGKVKFKNNFYYLSGTKIKDREKKYSQAEETFGKLDFLNSIFKKINFIKMVAVTGSLASYNFDKDIDDIDLFIIVEKGKVWITRFYLVLIFKMLNIYVNNRNPELKLCPNFYISEELSSWETEKRNIYTAHEILMMQPIFQKDDSYFKFLKSNTWVLEYYPNFLIENYELEIRFNKESTLLDLIDKLLMFIQKIFMGRKSGHEVLKKNFIHFNKYDHSQYVLDSYKRIEN